ncbi:unnamed protein product, partial [Phaeothamnion confervicola]
CGKTSLLFDFAYRRALRGQRVAFICDKHKVERSLPAPFLQSKCGGSASSAGAHHGDLEWEPSALELIGLKYVESREDLLWYLGSLQLLPPDARPAVLVVDDIDVIAATTAGAASRAAGAAAASGGPGVTPRRGKAAAEQSADILHVSALLQDAANALQQAGAPLPWIERRSCRAAVPPPSERLSSRREAMANSGGGYGDGGGSCGDTGSNGGGVGCDGGGGGGGGEVAVAVSCCTTSALLLGLMRRSLPLCVRVRRTTNVETYSLGPDETLPPVAGVSAVAAAGAGTGMDGATGAAGVLLDKTGRQWGDRFFEHRDGAFVHVPVT